MMKSALYIELSVYICPQLCSPKDLGAACKWMKSLSDEETALSSLPSRTYVVRTGYSHD